MVIAAKGPVAISSNMSPMKPFAVSFEGLPAARGRYARFLVHPIFRAVWISLHDWNLLAVAFNPDAKVFIGTENHVKVMWGRSPDFRGVPENGRASRISRRTGRCRTT